MSNSQALPVVAGLAVGTLLVIMFALVFPQSSVSSISGDYQARPGRLAETAIKIALADTQLQELIEGHDVSADFVRDWGVTAMDCPPNWCAIVLFDDRSTNMPRDFGAVSVNVQSGKVTQIALHQDFLIAKMKNEIEVVQLFLSKYPDSQVKVNRYPYDHAEVVFSVERSVDVPEGIRFWPDTHTLSLWIELNSSTDKIKDIYVECGTTMTERATTNLIEYVNTTDCLNPNWDDVDANAQTGVFELDPSGDELNGSLLVHERNDKINLTIVGMKTNYKAGEPIIFSVNAEGISDNTCNIGSPSVYMRDESDDEIIYWPNPFGFSTALLCGRTEPVDKEWKFGDDAESEMVLDKPGTYILVASLEGVTIEKSFIVTD